MDSLQAAIVAEDELAPAPNRRGRRELFKRICTRAQRLQVFGRVDRAYDYVDKRRPKAGDGPGEPVKLPHELVMRDKDVVAEAFLNEERSEASTAE